MSVLDRAALEQSPLADLHAIASELSIDGFRRLRRRELIDAILARQGTDEEATPIVEPATDEELSPPLAEGGQAQEEVERPRRRRGRRGGRGRTGREEASGREEAPESEREEAPESGHEEAPESGRDEAPESEQRGQEEDVPAEGMVELLSGGSGFVRVHPPEPSEDDVYISAAQVRRCELVSGDRVSGPRRPPRRSERFASLIRIDTINGRPASEIADSTRFDDLPAVFPQERFRLGSEDPTVKAIEWLTPFGRGSRVTIAGPARAGKTEALRRLAAGLAEQSGLQLLLVLAGVRPEEIFEWASGPVEPAAALSIAASPDAQGQAVERGVDQARRLAARGTHAVLLIDTLEGLQPAVARRAMAAARNIPDGGSLTIVATATEPLGGETTVITLDPGLASTGRFPAVDLAASWTIRPELLVGEAGAEAIARARMELLEG